MDGMLDVGYLMLATMTPKLQKQHEDMVAYQMIQNLKEIYEGKAHQERYETSKALFQCKMSEGSPVGAHVIKMMGYIQMLEKLGFALNDELAIDVVLQSLSDSFNQFGGSKSVLMLREGKGKGKKVAKSKGIGKTKPKGKEALKPKGGVSKDGKCFHYGKPGHWKRNFPIYLEDVKKAKAVGASVSGHNIIVSVKDVKAILGLKDEGVDVQEVLSRENDREVGHNIIVSVKDVKAILGLKDEGVDVQEVLSRENDREVGVKYNLGPFVNHAQIKRDIISRAFEGDCLKSRALLYNVGVFLCPTGPYGDVGGVSDLVLLVMPAKMTIFDVILLLEMLVEFVLYDYWSGFDSIAIVATNGVPHILYWVKSEVSYVYSRLKSKQSSNRPEHHLPEDKDELKVNESLEYMEAPKGEKASKRHKDSSNKTAIAEDASVVVDLFPTRDHPMGPTPVLHSYSSPPAAFVARPTGGVSPTAHVTPGNEVVWYLDFGATHHITSDRANLQADTAYTGTHSLLVGNGAKVNITHVDLDSLTSPTRSIQLGDLLCVPDIKKNLLSVSQFARDNNVYFEFYPHHCSVKDIQTKTLLLKGRLTTEGLYEL
ncbi:hypothetical protein GQ457_15G016610 [Hibiscus cannabinus]